VRLKYCLHAILRRWAWALLFFLSAGRLSANISRTVERVFSFAPGEIPLVKMEVFYGSVTVESADGAAVRIEVKLDFETDQESVADRVQKNLTLTFAQQGGVVTPARSIRAACIGISRVGHR